MQNKCINCGEHKNCKDSFASWIFFIIGLIAAFAIRLVTILVHVNPLYSKISWYIGVIGFSAFFIYKYRISQARAKVVEQNQLGRKILKKEELKESDRIVLGEILCSLTSKKERINYFFIFALSAVAITLVIYMDFIR